MGIALFTLKSVAYAITDPTLLLMLVVIAFVQYRQNKNVVAMQRMMMGESSDSPFVLTISQVVIGLFAGIVASLMLSYLGIAFDENSPIYIMFFISIIFMIIKPKFIEFAYSGAVLGIISLVLSFFTIPKSSLLNDFKLNIPALMTLVSVIYIIEGFLIIIDGKRGAIPIFTNRENKIVGGFALNRFWIAPIALLIILQDKTSSSLVSQIATPNWWPLLNNSITPVLLKTAVLALMPFYGIIGYSRTTFTMDKKKRTLISGLTIACYGIVLFGFAQLAQFNLYFKILVLIFAPLVYEIILRAENHFEYSHTPKYVSSVDGIKVLDVAPNSPAYDMKIKSGDTIVEVNNKKVENEKDIFAALDEISNFIWFKIQKSNGEVEEVNYNKMNAHKRLGIVFVPIEMPKDGRIVKVVK